MKHEMRFLRPEDVDAGTLLATISGVEAEWRVYIHGTEFWVQLWPRGGFADGTHLHAAGARSVSVWAGGEPLAMWSAAIDYAQRMAYSEMETELSLGNTDWR
jgi:hypothetical protein